MNLQKHILFLMTASFFIPLISHAKLLTEVHCPKEISTQQSLIAVQTIPAEFTSRVENSKNYLEGFTFYSGKPDENASLAPDQTLGKKTIWTFLKSDTIYISCRYHQTNVEIFKALPKNTSACTVIYDLQKLGSSTGVLPPKKITCES